MGVDIDPVLIAAAQHDHPGPTWLVADLAELDLTASGIKEEFDVGVCAGNVMPFLDPDTRQRVLDRLATHLQVGGRIVTGFGSGRDHSFAEYFADVDEVGLVTKVVFSTWDFATVHHRLRLPRRSAVAGRYHDLTAFIQPDAMSAPPGTRGLR